MTPLPHSTSNPIGQRLKEEMKKRSINSAELAKRAGVKTSFIYDVISGKSANPSTVKLARVAESLGVSLNWLAASSIANMPAALPDDLITIPSLKIEGNARVVSLPAEDAPFVFNREWLTHQLHAEPAGLRT